MQYRTLGRTGLRVSDIGFGAMTIGGEVFGATDDQESLRALHRALDLGMNFIDTADAYGRGHSEELIAQVLKTRRSEVILATKGGNQFTVRQGLRNFDPDYITSALEASLKRLQIETIDLYQLHNPSQEVMRRGEIFARLDRFKREGKIRFYGVSLEKTNDGLVAIETGKPDTIQVVYNILHQDPEEKLFPLAQKENIGILARVPLERGVLTGRFKSTTEFAQKDWRRGVFSEEGLAQTHAAVEKLGFLVKGDVPNLAQAALRFILSNPVVSTVIPGIRTVQQTETNIAVSGKMLPTEDVTKLRDLYRREFCHLPFH
ncbi:MAG TPA: aldo/keto reductase [Candidatus Binatia bacterium]|nr:aldo/keto reductase [Candidatus Binatia bacterium]